MHAKLVNGERLQPVIHDPRRGFKLSTKPYNACTRRRFVDQIRKTKGKRLECGASCYIRGNFGSGKVLFRHGQPPVENPQYFSRFLHGPPPKVSHTKVKILVHADEPATFCFELFLHLRIYLYRPVLLVSDQNHPSPTHIRCFLTQ